MPEFPSGKTGADPSVQRGYCPDACDPGNGCHQPADDIEARAAVKAAYEYVGPVYLRFGRLAVPVINDGADYKFEIGKGVTLREGSDCSIIATGLCVSEALAAADTLAEQGIHAEVINIHTIKPA